MARYRNTRTEQVVERRHRDTRLDGLAVWERLDEPAAPAAPAEPDEPEQPAPEPVPEPVDEPAPEPPARSANRPEWESYARTHGATEAEIDDMTKAELIERYG